MTDKDNNEKLRELVDYAREELGLTREMVSHLIHAAVKYVDGRPRTATLDKWLTSPGGINFRKCPRAYVELLERKLDEIERVVDYGENSKCWKIYKDEPWFDKWWDGFEIEEE